MTKCSIVAPNRIIILYSNLQAAVTAVVVAAVRISYYVIVKNITRR